MESLITPSENWSPLQKETRKRSPNPMGIQRQEQLQLLRTTLGVQRLLPPRAARVRVMRLQGYLRESPALSQHPRLLAQRLRLGGGPWAPAPYSISTACSRELQPLLSLEPARVPPRPRL